MPKKAWPSRITVSAKNDEQKNMLRTITENTVTFVKGAPGSGKTYLAVAYGVQALLQEEFQHLVFTRPVVEAGGERLGFLPGTMHEKIDPYMIPIFETLHQFLPPDMIQKLMPRNGNGGVFANTPIRILPLAYMRGVTLKDSYIVCDEMQNSTPEQIRMILTRLGYGSRIVLCGDIYQTDINTSNGLSDAFQLLKDIRGIGFVTLTEDAIMRHPIIREIETRYHARDLPRTKVRKVV